MRWESTTKAHVAIIDDNEENLELARRFLTQEDYEVKTSTSGKECLKKIDSEVCDLILLDIEMPDENGFSVAKKIKGNPATRDIPIMFLTARADREDVIQGYELGAVDYIVKPFHRRELLARVNNQIELQKQRHALLQAISEKDRIFSILSHDLKNSFQGMLSLAELMRQELNTFSMEDMKKKVQILNQNAHNVNHLLKSLLDWARIQQNTLRPKPRNMLINRIIDLTINLYSRLAEEKEVSITTDIEDNYSVYADPDILFTIMRNLLNNAIKFTHSGGNIHIYTWKLGNEIMVSVKDNGIGMKRNQVSDLYAQVGHLSHKGTQGERGTGLGLYLVSEFIRALGGELIIGSEIGEGSVFSFPLPVSKAQSQSHEEPPSADSSTPEKTSEPSQTESPQGTKSLHILFADDEEINRIVATRLLQKAGHEITAAKAAEEALELLGNPEKEKFHVVITDLNMPGMSGVALLQKIRNDFPDSKIPVFLYSAEDEDEIQLREKEAGISFTGILEKPLKVDRFNQLYQQWEKESQ